MASMEFGANDVETAVAQGLAQLKLIRAEVKIEVLDEGSRGVLGIGARQARVRLTPFAEIEASQAAATSAATLAPSSPESETEPTVGDDAGLIGHDDGEFASNLPVPPMRTGDGGGAPIDAGGTNLEASEEDQDGDDDSDEVDNKDATESEIEIDGAPVAASLTLGILERMDFGTATCISRSILPSDEQDQPVIWVDIDFEPNEEGDEQADSLLAHQQEALYALQSLVQIMWSHQTKSGVRITLDVNGYKARRQSQLQQMAERMAERVISTGRSITLEPMNPADRRLVHMALRDHPDVFTESQGEGSSRKVIIQLKK